MNREATHCDVVKI
ncbi:hypothetical protein NYP83_14650 [Erwinia pyrifoliae]|uniref:Uncharacterized protein n=1 Tax=Erwinia pyrifoliae TaxID=79967 RepID=A0ABY5XEK1_ERWPY|nr:hypothetical protein [Erwinia pyrifoliae]MCT2386302.1 hypothetical protein [Erwinia pyrifoliae]MCU8588101.1 hypothetical protein [Erwinia pyrifoliae]UWS31790.1 hypothetical protein NYP81_11065 [Erwinia pyrifoliae]UWS35363.1 hypothetical protein NYP84_03675 [Erwinia pyrifoliae]UXK14213.1 hypothetical protein NYP80_14435 [Erwinia pyrifoliae]